MLKESSKGFTPFRNKETFNIKGNSERRFLTGFTLIELLVVIAIIAILAVLIIIRITTGIKDARDSRRKSDIAQLQEALEMYYLKNGEYPLSGGATYPNSGWSNSSDSSWDTLQNELKDYTNLPKDPIDESGGWAASNFHNYTYYSVNYNCEQQWYMLVYLLEINNTPSPGAYTCSSEKPYFNYAGPPDGTNPRAITVGENKKN